MSLRDIQLKKAYSSDDDDILSNFYIPALRNATEYCRLAGFFSSTSLAIAARGVLGLIKNGGFIKILTSPQLHKKDIEVIKESVESPERYIEGILLSELDDFKNKFVEQHLYALGWMIANKRLEIRIAVVHDENGIPIGSKDIQLGGIFHQKVGILKDGLENIVTFSGSVNETASAWLANIEEFKTFRSWVSAENDYINADIDKFEKYWNGLPGRIRVMEVPQAVRERLIQIAPLNIESIELSTMYKDLDMSKKVCLYPHQKEAVNAWLKNKKRGIFEMATGTGKTYAALGCLEKAQQSGTKVLTVVACPKNHLVQQWKREVDKFGIKYEKLIVADGTNPGWKDELTDSMIDLAIGHIENLLTITTHTTLSSNHFKTIISENKDDIKAFIIGDEVHGLGSEMRKKGLIDAYDLRLGLSATPKRWFDTAGTRKLYDYFGNIVYEFDLRRAVTRINPATGKTFLTPYRYIPSFVSLTDEELELYTEKTRVIGVKFNQAKNEDERDEFLEKIIFERADILKNAQAKYEVLDDLLSNISPLKWTLIYCSPQQIKTVMRILNHHELIAHRFTMKEGKKPNSNYNGISEREYLLNEFAEGTYQVLVAMKCLDEGVDIPPARNAILMASSGNPRQYIQRIGRVVRRYSNKTEANIYDIAIMPNISLYDSSMSSIEQAIFDKELSRYEEIANNAINSIESLKMIYEIRSTFLEER